MRQEPLEELLAFASTITVVTGSGISANSGLATYRSGGSQWSDPDLERKSHARSYGNHLAELWQFWSMLREGTLQAEPTAAHRAIAGWERTKDVHVLTQNIDGLHQRAGSSHVLELHGTIHATRCLRCPHVTGNDQRLVPPAGRGNWTSLTCSGCGSEKTRPDVVLFGESLSKKLVKEAREALKESDLCLYVGTSGEVWPVRDFVTLAHDSGAATVLVNKDPWNDPHKHFQYTYLGDADTILGA